MVNCSELFAVPDVTLVPFIPAGKAFRLVNTHHLTAFRTDPLRFFIPNEMPDSEFIYHVEILNHAHAISGSISFIQLVQCRTGKDVTLEAVADFPLCYRFTCFDFAYDPGFWLCAVVFSAAGAMIFFPYICTTKTAVHPAGGDQFCGNSVKRVCGHLNS